MTIGVGGSTAAIELEKLTNMTTSISAICPNEYKKRIKKAQHLMKENGISATYLNAGTNLYYFTGTQWYASERMVGAILPAEGEIHYICPYFEINTLKQYMIVTGEIHGWQEHESPYDLCARTLESIEITSGKLAIDESTAFFIANGIKQAINNFEIIDARAVTAGCRSEKSDQEIALLQTAKDMTLEVQKAAARILHIGISTAEVIHFIHQAHIKVGAPAGSYFCIVLFGKDSSFPHGVKQPKKLAENDMVLIDTGCQVEGYNSDITRTYVFGQANERQRAMWAIEKNAQEAAFNAAQLGEPCCNADIAARQYLASQQLGPEYQTPGCPHRTGHGVGLDIHEWPYLVKSDQTILTKGMCFSNEPMLVIPDEFGIRLEDHFYMTNEGAKWFTTPSHSIDDPFGYNNN